MAGQTDYVAANLLNYLTGKSASGPFAVAPTAYVALFTTPPTSKSGVTGATEVAGGAYARQQTSAATWNAASNSAGSEPGVTPANISNLLAITFPIATANWGTVIAFGIFDALTVGNLLYWDYIGNFSWLPTSVSAASPAVITTGQAHNYANGDIVVATTEYGGALPTFSQSNFTGQLTVANATATTFTVTNAATAVNTSVAGDPQFRKIFSQPTPTGAQVSFAIGTLVITSA